MVQKVLSIAILTVKGAIKQKLVIFLAMALVLSVILLPTFIKHDETATGYASIILGYTLTLVTIILGVVTIWLGCSAISKELEECQMQVLVVKPVSRAQVWLGKLMGILAINFVLLGLSAIIISCVLVLKSGELNQSEKEMLNEKILVARSAVSEETPDLTPFIEERFKTIVEEQDLPSENWDAVKTQIKADVEKEYQLVRPGAARIWQLDFSLKKSKLVDKPLFLRVKMQTPAFLLDDEDPNLYPTVWHIGKGMAENASFRELNVPVGVWYEFALLPGSIDDDGNLYIMMQNMSNSELLFPMVDSLEVLYREGGFIANYLRGIFILYCWLALVAMLALTASSFLSFSVAAFLCMTALIIFFSRDAIASTLDTNTILGIDYNDSKNGPTRYYPVIDAIGLPFLEAIKFALDLIADFSPVDSLSNGRTVGWDQILRAFLQIIVLFGGTLSSIGIFIFQKREIATAQGK